MSNKDTGGPAFPTDNGMEGGLWRGSPGMTLRDYFAAKAGEKDIEPYWAAPLNREQAKYKYADAMLSARGTEKARNT